MQSRVYVYEDDGKHLCATNVFIGEISEFGAQYVWVTSEIYSDVLIKWHDDKLCVEFTNEKGIKHITPLKKREEE